MTGAGLTSLVIVASGRCNLRCSYCRVERTPAVPPWSAVRPALDAVVHGAGRRPALVAFTGGEPLLAFTLVRRAVAYIESRRDPAHEVTYRLATNGLLLRQQHIAFLERHRFDVQISVDGDLAAQDVRAPGTFRPLAGLLARLAHHWPAFLRHRVTAAVTVTPETLPLLADSIRFLLDQGVSTIQVGAAMGVGTATPDLPEIDRQVGRIARMMRDRHRRTGEVPVRGLRRPFGGQARGAARWGCNAPTGEQLAIDADGGRFPCLMATRTYARRAPAVMKQHLGELRSRLEEGRDVPLRLFARPSQRYSSHGRCADCRWVRDCLVCPLAPVMEAGWDDAFRVPDFLCAFSRTLLEHRERMPMVPPAGLESLAPFMRPTPRPAPAPRARGPALSAARRSRPR